MRLGRGWFGWVIVLVGVLWALSILGVAHASLGDLIGTWWPAVLALWGLLSIFDRSFHRERGIFLPAAALVVGLLLLFDNLNIWQLASGNIWLLILALAVIAIGLEAALGSRWWRGRHVSWEIGSPRRMRQQRRAYSVRDREIHVPLGEVDFDVHEGDLPDGETSLDVSVQLGSIHLRIDPAVGLVVHAQVGVGELRLGGIVAEGAQRDADYASENAQTAAKCLTLRLSAGVGSIDIRHGW